jgi:hypothetical protein
MDKIKIFPNFNNKRVIKFFESLNGVIYFFSIFSFIILLFMKIHKILFHSFNFVEIEFLLISFFIALISWIINKLCFE